MILLLGRPKYLEPSDLLKHQYLSHELLVGSLFPGNLAYGIHNSQLCKHGDG